MKRGTTGLALIGTGLFIACGLLLIGFGVGSLASPWCVDGGIVGWLLNYKSVPVPVFGRNPVGAITPVVLAVLSFVLGVVLIGFGLSCGVAGLVTGVIGSSGRGTASQSRRWLLAGIPVVTLMVLVPSAIWLTLVRPNHDVAAAIQAIENRGGDVAVTGGARKRIVGVTWVKATDAGLKELKGLKTLETLNVANSAVTDAGLKELKGLRELQMLSLGGTRVMDAGLKALPPLAALQSLDLSSTRVTDAGLKELTGLKNLRHLDLRKTDVSDAGVAALKKALPELTIRR
jgi:hypothetical protein